MSLRMFNPTPFFIDGNGAPRAGAKLNFYLSGTSTRLDTFSDSTLTTPNANPVVADANGQFGDIFLSSASYKVVLTDSSDVTIRTWDPVRGAGSDLEGFNRGTLGGTANAITLVVPGVVTYETDRVFLFRATAENTGATTLNINSLGAKNIYIPGADGLTPLVGGEIQSGQTVVVIYDGTQFVLSSAPAGVVTRLTDGLGITTSGTTVSVNPWILRGYIAGLALSNNSGDANNDIDIATGVAVDSTAAAFLRLNAAMTKQLDVAWAAGTAAGGLDTGSKANSTWYHLHLIGRDLPATTTRARSSNVATIEFGSAHGLGVGSTIILHSMAGGYNGVYTVASVPNTTSLTFANTGSDEAETADTAGDGYGCDVLFSTSASAPTMPSNFTYRRRIGSARTDSSGNIKAFSQNGEEFLWKSPVLDVDALNPGTSAVLRTLTVPSGVKVNALVNAQLDNLSTGGNGHMYLSSPDVDDEASSLTAAPLNQTGLAYNGAGGASRQASQANIRSNTSAQIRSRLGYSDGNVTLKIATVGWLDRRGRDE